MIKGSIAGESGEGNRERRGNRGWGTGEQTNRETGEEGSRRTGEQENRSGYWESGRTKAFLLLLPRISSPPPPPPTSCTFPGASTILLLPPVHTCNAGLILTRHCKTCKMALSLVLIQCPPDFPSIHTTINEKVV